MRRLMEGSQAIAEAVLHCRPDVVPAYPITPQTHIVEAIGRALRARPNENQQFLTVESEFAAMSAAIGASAAGSRTYTATASQGLLYMAEALFNAAGLGLPIVLTVANRAIGAPINIWNDQSDSMSLRDCGWIQLYAQDNQDAVDLHVLAFRLAETLDVPVMVCVDGFVLTHAFEPLEVPDQALVAAFLPERQPRQRLSPDAPLTIGAMVGPEAFAEVRYLAHRQQLRAIEVFGELSEDYRRRSGRSLSPVSGYRTDGAELIVVTTGSVNGTLRDSVDELRGRGLSVGAVTVTMYRPFPAGPFLDQLGAATRVVVLERAFAPGAGGIVSDDVQRVRPGAVVHTVVAGLGGRAIGQAALSDAIATVAGRAEPSLTFLDLHTDVVERELQRLAEPPSIGVPTHNLIRAARPAGSRIH